MDPGRSELPSECMRQTRNRNERYSIEVHEICVGVRWGSARDQS